MVYLPILCHLILIFDVFEPSKINYARGFLTFSDGSVKRNPVNSSCLMSFYCLLIIENPPDSIDNIFQGDEISWNYRNWRNNR